MSGPPYETSSAAAYLASLGFRIFPIAPGMKGAPLVKAWQDVATSDAAQVAQWWPKGSQNNIGLAAGSGRLTFDIDLQKPGCREALEALETKYGPLPRTLTVASPRGGKHLHYMGPDVGNSAAKLGPGLDIKGPGGYVVGPWSYTVEIPEKQGAGFYNVLDDAPVAEAPAWLVELAGGTRSEIDNRPAPPATTISETQLADLKSALAHPAFLESVGGHSEWSEVGYALLTLGDVGKELWCEFSGRAANPNSGMDDAESWWGRHQRSRSRTDFKHIFTLAGRLGWKNPNRGGDPNAAGFGQSPMPAIAVALPSPQNPGRFTPVDAWAYADGPDPRWRVDGLLPEQGLAMIYGASGSGKSFFTLDLVMAIARGVPYGYERLDTLPGRIVYVVAEGAGGFRKRLRAYRTHHRLMVSSPALRLVTAAPNMMSESDLIELQAAITGTGGADVTVIDTLHASASGGDENSAKDMGLYLAHCRALQAVTKGLVVVIHHSGKDEERGARGSSAIKAAMDTEIEVNSGSEFSTARVTKQRDGDDSGAVCFRLVPVTLQGDRPGSSAVVEHLPRPAKARKAKCSKEQSLVVQQVQAMLPTYPNGMQMEILVAAISSVRPDMRLDSVKRSITRAIDADLLMIDRDQNVRLPLAALQHRSIT